MRQPGKPQRLAFALRGKSLLTRRFRLHSCNLLQFTEHFRVAFALYVSNFFRLRRLVALLLLVPDETVLQKGVTVLVQLRKDGVACCALGIVLTAESGNGCGASGGNGLDC